MVRAIISANRISEDAFFFRIGFYTEVLLSNTALVS